MIFVFQNISPWLILFFLLNLLALGSIFFLLLRKNFLPKEAFEEPLPLIKLKKAMANTRKNWEEKWKEFWSNGPADWEEGLFRLLCSADVGVKTSKFLVSELKGMKALPEAELHKTLENLMIKVLNHHQRSFSLETSQGKPFICLVVGVNGVGKTTSMGKLANHLSSQGKKVLLVAGDTFRAAAVDQLKIWAERLHLEIVSHKQGTDPGAVVFDGMKKAEAGNYDVVLIDTAGRLHNKDDLMAELGKIRRIIGKTYPSAPHETLLVLDGTTGQNAYQQVKIFKEICQVSGLVITKLDGTAKGGVLVGLADEFQLPIFFVGLGEGQEDLEPFQPQKFVEHLFR